MELHQHRSFPYENEKVEPEITGQSKSKFPKQGNSSAYLWIIAQATAKDKQKLL